MSVLHFLGDNPVGHVKQMYLSYPAASSYCFFPSAYFQAPYAGAISFILLSVQGLNLSSVFWCDLSGFLWGFSMFSDKLFPAG